MMALQLLPWMLAVHSPFCYDGVIVKSGHLVVFHGGPCPCECSTCWPGHKTVAPLGGCAAETELVERTDIVFGRVTSPATTLNDVRRRPIKPNGCVSGKRFKVSTKQFTPTALSDTGSTKCCLPKDVPTWPLKTARATPAR